MFNIYNTIGLLVLGPLLFYPFTFCPFHLPYLYCLICPARCGWGKIRGIILLIILGLNINRDFFCNSLCPLGNLQRLLFRLKLPKFTLPLFVSTGGQKIFVYNHPGMNRGAQAAKPRKMFSLYSDIIVLSAVNTILTIIYPPLSIGN